MFLCDRPFRNVLWDLISVTMIVVNNGIFGMTGGQMCPATTLVGDKTVSSKKGRDDKVAGEPFVKELGIIRSRMQQSSQNEKTIDDKRRC